MGKYRQSRQKQRGNRQKSRQQSGRGDSADQSFKGGVTQSPADRQETEQAA